MGHPNLCITATFFFIAATFCLAGLIPVHAYGESPIILNEYNVVGSRKMLEHDGKDSHFGRVIGNVGRGIELIVTLAGLDARGYQLAWEEGENSGVITLSDNKFWSSLPRGLIVTLTEHSGEEGGHDNDTDLDFDSQADDRWVNIHLGDERLIRPNEDGQPPSFSAGNDNFILTILNAEGQKVFGPTGEGAPDRSAPTPVPETHHNPGPVSEPVSESRNILERLKTIDIPGTSAEIVQYCVAEDLLLVTNPLWDTLDLFQVKSLDPPVITPLPDRDEQRPGIQGIHLAASPTSVAVHPTQPLALVCMLGRSSTEPGRVVGYDLRPSTRGSEVINVAVGIHPDSIAVSPDGRFAVVANEAEGHPDTPGSVSVIDLTGVTAQTRVAAYTPAVTHLAGLGHPLQAPDGQVEPEFVAFDPQSRFVAVSCQENDAILLINLVSSTPSVQSVLWLPRGSEPDGVALLDGVAGPHGRVGCLLAVAEEGKYDAYRDLWLGQAVSFHWIDPLAPHAEPITLSRMDVRTLTGRIGKRCDPEGVLLVRHADKQLALVTIERGDWLLCLDVDDPTHPRLLKKERTGDRPEGLIAIPHGGNLIAITADEGNEGPGELSFFRLAADPPMKAVRQ